MFLLVSLITSLSFAQDIPQLHDPVSMRVGEAIGIKNSDLRVALFCQTDIDRVQGENNISAHSESCEDGLYALIEYHGYNSSKAPTIIASAISPTNDYNYLFNGSKNERFPNADGFRQIENDIMGIRGFRASIPKSVFVSRFREGTAIQLADSDLKMALFCDDDVADLKQKKSIPGRSHPCVAGTYSLVEYYPKSYAQPPIIVASKIKPREEYTYLLSGVRDEKTKSKKEYGKIRKALMLAGTPSILNFKANTIIGNGILNEVTGEFIFAKCSADWNENKLCRDIQFFIGKTDSKNTKSVTENILNNDVRPLGNEVTSENAESILSVARSYLSPDQIIVHQPKQPIPPKHPEQNVPNVIVTYHGNLTDLDNAPTSYYCTEAGRSFVPKSGFSFLQWAQYIQVTQVFHLAENAINRENSIGCVSKDYYYPDKLAAQSNINSQAAALAFYDSHFKQFDSFSDFVNTFGHSFPQFVNKAEIDAAKAAYANSIIEFEKNQSQYEQELEQWKASLDSKSTRKVVHATDANILRSLAVDEKEAKHLFADFNVAWNALVFTPHLTNESETVTPVNSHTFEVIEKAIESEKPNETTQTISD